MPFYSFNKYLPRASRSQGILLGLRDIVVHKAEVQFTGFRFFWRKTENKHANLCSVNLSLSFIVCLFFMSVLLLSSMLQLSAEELLAKGKVGVELWLGAGF